MTVDNVIFQTNNVSTVDALDPFSSTDEPEKRPLKEFLIKFLVSNGQQPLTLDFKTFCSSTGLDYNNGKYVEHPTPEVVKKELGKNSINPSYLDKTPVLKNSFPVAWRILFTFVIQVLGGNYSSTEQVNSIQQLFSYSLITGTEVDIWEIIYSDLVTKLLNKSRLKYVSYPRFISCALQVLLGLDYTQDKKFGDSVSPPPLAAKPKKEKSQTVTSTSPKSQGPERDIQLVSMRLPSTLDEGTRKSKPLPEGTATHTKDSGGNKQPLDWDITFTTPGEGTAKTTLRPEGSHRDKDSGGNKPPVDIEPQNPTDVDLSGIGAKYQEDQTQSSRLRYQSLTGNKGEPSYEGEPDTQPMILSYADVRAILLSEDEAQESEEDILGAGKGMDNNLPSDETQHQSSTPQKTNPLLPLLPTLKHSTLILQEKHEGATVHYVSLKASIDDYYNENIARRDQTDKLVKASMSSLEKSCTTISDLYKGLEVITQLLKDITNYINNDPAINKKLEEASETFANISTQTTEILSSVRSFNFSTLKSTVKIIQDHAFKQEEALASWMKSSTNMAWNIGENATQTATKEPLSHTEGETDANIQEKPKELKQSTDANIEFIGSSTHLPSITQAQPITIIHPKPYVPQREGKLRIKFVINGKTVYLIEQEIQAYWDKEEEIKKSEEEAKLNAISKLEVIKVVCEEAKKLGIHPKEAIITKAGELFKKAQDAEHEVLKRQHTKKHMELEPETRISGLECNRALPESVPFIKNMVIEGLEYGIFFMTNLVIKHSKDGVTTTKWEWKLLCHI
nr:hypothetical protein [Tanacetum cinerariifolium]